MKGRRVTPPIWAIVLTGGDGIRLKELTRKFDGDGRPKQFSRITPLFNVSRFCEKPPLSEACQLMKQGGFWNTFITIGRAGAFLKLLSATVLPTMVRIAEAIVGSDLDSVYKEIETIDFSKHILSVKPRDLLVMPDGASGWADLGDQARVIDTLDRHEMEPEWLREMRRSNILGSLNGQVRVPQQTSRAVMHDTVTV